MERHRIRFVSTVVLAGAVALGAAGCGDDNSAGSTPELTTDASTPTSTATAALTTVTPEEGSQLIQELGAELTVIDVRTAEEFAAGHIEGAVNYDIEGGQFSALVAPLDRGAPYMVYCHSGRRSALAAQAMVAAGFTQVYDLGGISDWVAAGLPVVTG